MLPLTKDAWGYQKLEETRQDLPLEASEEYEPVNTLTLGYIASTTVSEYTSIVLSHPVCSNFVMAAVGN